MVYFAVRRNHPPLGLHLTDILTTPLIHSALIPIASQNERRKNKGQRGRGERAKQPGIQFIVRFYDPVEAHRARVTRRNSKWAAVAPHNRQLLCTRAKVVNGSGRRRQRRAREDEPCRSKWLREIRRKQRIALLASGKRQNTRIVATLFLLLYHAAVLYSPDIVKAIRSLYGRVIPGAFATTRKIKQAFRKNFRKREICWGYTFCTNQTHKPGQCNISFLI